MKTGIWARDQLKDLTHLDLLESRWDWWESRLQHNGSASQQRAVGRMSVERLRMSQSENAGSSHREAGHLTHEAVHSKTRTWAGGRIGGTCG